MKVEPGKRVKIDYELKFEGGAVIESSSAAGPLSYIHGAGKMLPALESRMEGMTVGDERDGVIPAVEIYGDAEQLPTREIPLAELPGGAEVGQKFQAKDPSGTDVTFVVTEVGDDKVTVRMEGNPILYRVKVLDVGDSAAPPPMPGEGGPGVAHTDVVETLDADLLEEEADDAKDGDAKDGDAKDGD